jgi:glutamyl-tRNA reductase
VPTIRALRDQYTRIADVEAQKVIDQLRRKEMTADQRDEAVRRLATLLVNKLLHAPQTALKEATPEDADRLVEAVVRLHKVDPAAFEEPEKPSESHEENARDRHAR